MSQLHSATFQINFRTEDGLHGSATYYYDKDCRPVFSGHGLPVDDLHVVQFLTEEVHFVIGPLSNPRKVFSFFPDQQPCRQMPLPLQLPSDICHPPDLADYAVALVRETP